MKQKFVFCVTLFGFLLISDTSARTNTEDVDLHSLVLTHVLFRHGDRNPEYAYPKDPYQSESLWPGGWGQLTQKGKEETYNLGQYYRKRYDGFISKSYVTDEVYALSSDVTRAILSELLVLAGLFPTEGQNNWSEHINWQPVPIRTIPQSQDNMLWLSKPCPKYWSSFKNFMYYSDLMKTINTRNEDLYVFLTEKTGVNITHINHFYKFYSTLQIENENNFTLPNWAPQILDSDNFNELFQLSMKTLTYTTQFKRLRSGPLLEYIVGNIQNKLGLNEKSKRIKEKMFLLSGHDVTLSHLLDTLGVFDSPIPGYASSIIIECHRNLSSRYENFYVNILFRNDTSRHPYKLSLPGCHFNCPLDSFLNFTSAFIPTDWESECSLLQAKKYYFSGEILASILGGLVILFLIIIILVVVVNKRKRSKGSVFLRRDYET